MYCWTKSIWGKKKKKKKKSWVERFLTMSAIIIIKIYFGQPWSQSKTCSLSTTMTGQFLPMAKKKSLEVMWPHTNCPASLMASVEMRLIQRESCCILTFSVFTHMTRTGESHWDKTSIRTARGQIDHLQWMGCFSLHSFVPSIPLPPRSTLIQPPSPPVFCSAQQDITSCRLSHLVTKEQH